MTRDLYHKQRFIAKANDENRNGHLRRDVLVSINEIGDKYDKGSNETKIKYK